MLTCLHVQLENLLKKIHQLEEQLHGEMQLKDEMEQKCRASSTKLDKILKELEEEVCCCSLLVVCLFFFNLCSGVGFIASIVPLHFRPSSV